MNKLLSCNFIFSKKNCTINRQDKEIVTILNSLMNSFNKNESPDRKVIVSNPIFHKDSNLVIITIFYFEGRKNVFPKNYLNQKAEQIITKHYSNNVSVNFTRVYYPYINASIFAQYLFYNSSANTFLHFQNSVQKYISWHGKELLSHVKGVKIEVSGRMMTEKAIPRVTRKSVVHGSLSNSHFIDYAKYTNKNFIGSITIKV